MPLCIFLSNEQGMPTCHNIFRPEVQLRPCFTSHSCCALPHNTGCSGGGVGLTGQVRGGLEASRLGAEQAVRESRQEHVVSTYGGSIQNTSPYEVSCGIQCLRYAYAHSEYWPSGLMVQQGSVSSRYPSACMYDPCMYVYSDLV